jgi:hypothetical protein
MYLLLGDEADHEQRMGARFFVYGGLFIDIARVQALHAAVAGIREEIGFRPTDSLKFATNDRPAHITKDQHTEAKRRVIAAAHEHDAHFSAQVTLHELARNTNHDELVKRGANTILACFDRFLERAGDYGLALLDRLPVRDQYLYLREKFQVGLSFPNNAVRPLKRILGLASTCDGASHLASVADIVLGSFRYCVNEPERDIAGRAMLPNVCSADVAPSRTRPNLSTRPWTVAPPAEDQGTSV